MNKEKQIEEMAKDVCTLIEEYGNCEKCDTELDIDDEPCIYKCMAKLFAEKGYRKASDVARKTVEAIKNEVNKKEFWVSEFDGCTYGGYVILITDLDDIIRRYMFDTYEETELKKKYTEGEG